MATWHYVEDYVVCSFYLDHIGSWRSNMNIVMETLNRVGFGGRDENSVKMRIGNYEYLHTGNKGLSNIAKQSKAIYAAKIARMAKVSVYSTITTSLSSLYIPRSGYDKFSLLTIERRELSEAVSPRSLGPTFSDVLFDLIDKHGFNKDSEVYKAAQVGRDTFSAIRCGKYKNVSKRTVLQLCIGAKLTYEEAVELLESAGFAFSKSNKTDVIVSLCLKHEIYDIFEINDILYEEGANLLFGDLQ